MIAADTRESPQHLLGCVFILTDGSSGSATKGISRDQFAT